jgi:hypothetical protein
MDIATILRMDTVIPHMDTIGPIGTTAITTTTGARTTMGTATTANIGIIIATTDTNSM